MRGWRSLLVLGLLAHGLDAAAQRVTNVTAEQQGQALVIGYALDAEGPVEVQLFLSTDRGRTWDGPLKSCTGDLGKDVKPGTGKRIRWEVLQDRELVSDGVQFKVVAKGRGTLSSLESDMVRVSGGTFLMGCTVEQGSECGAHEKPAHHVSVGTFWMSKYEVTVGQFRAFVQATGHHTAADLDGGSYIWTGTDVEKRSGVNWSHDGYGRKWGAEGDGHPVMHVSWDDAVAFAKWVSATTGKHYRLPTEAEWEYAARGGSYGLGRKYAGSNDLGSVAWHNGNSGGRTHPVGQKASNELGLYDMSGNVWEWCLDWFGESYYRSSPSTAPQGPASGEYRVVRGGSWNFIPEYCRLASRFWVSPGAQNLSLGFRLARTE